MNKSCPDFECLHFSLFRCAKHPACDGCERQYSCESCQNRSNLAANCILLCDKIDLPEACRFCEKRESDKFIPEEDCIGCFVKEKAEESEYGSLRNIPVREPGVNKIKRMRGNKDYEQD